MDRQRHTDRRQLKLLLRKEESMGLLGAKHEDSKANTTLDY